MLKQHLRKGSHTIVETKTRAAAIAPLSSQEAKTEGSKACPTLSLPFKSLDFNVCIWLKYFKRQCVIQGRGGKAYRTDMTTGVRVRPEKII